jgi:hypothetical protein
MNLKIAPFKIEFLYYGKVYHAKVEQTFLSDLNERFTVTGGKKSIAILSDRPGIRNSNGKKKIKMQALDVSADHKQVIEIIIQKIQDCIYSLEHPPFDWSQHPKNASK